MQANEMVVGEIEKHLQDGKHFVTEGPQGKVFAIGITHSALGEWRYQLVSPAGSAAPPPLGAVRGMGMLLSQMELTAPLSEWSGEES